MFGQPLKDCVLIGWGESESVSFSVVSDFLQPHGLQLDGLL